ncbi:MAG: NADH-quinone oxidoreductase subunit J [Thermaerobacterales bacterium]
MAEFNIQLVIFGVLAGTTLLGAYKVVAADYVTHAALYLALVLVSVAGLFILLNADFLAMAQILIYVGAILAVFVFAVMLSELQELGGPSSRERGGFFAEFRRAASSPYLGSAPVFVAGALLILVLYSFRQWFAMVPTDTVIDNTALAIGRVLFTQYFIPFELASLILLVAMIGAIILVKGEGADQ